MVVRYSLGCKCKIRLIIEEQEVLGAVEILLVIDAMDKQIKVDVIIEPSTIMILMRRCGEVGREKDVRLPMWSVRTEVRSLCRLQ